MLKTFLIGLSIFSSSISLGQARDTAILFVPCKSGELIIDGISKGFKEANDVHREQLTFGDHYIQLKADNEKFGIILNNKFDIRLHKSEQTISVSLNWRSILF